MKKLLMYLFFGTCGITALHADAATPAPDVNALTSKEFTEQELQAIVKEDIDAIEKSADVVSPTAQPTEPAKEAAPEPTPAPVTAAPLPAEPAVAPAPTPAMPATESAAQAPAAVNPEQSAPVVPAPASTPEAPTAK